MQQRADAWGRPVVGVSNPEATTIGAAMLAAVCGGVFPDVAAAAAALVRLDAVVVSRPAVTAAYNAAYRRWLSARIW
jgi:ribulose kinase